MPADRRNSLGDVSGSQIVAKIPSLKLAPVFENFAPGEARTPDLRISLSVLTYKYDALTDCATGAMLGRFFPYAKFA